MRVHLGALVRVCGIVVAAIAGSSAVLRSHVLRTMALGLCLLVGTAWASTASYYYDELGRLIETVAADGTSVLYTYDATGNITSVKHDAVSTVGISGFVPAAAPIGASVTIFGSGFNTTVASNVVKFNGVSASVTVATATTLTVTVPTGATTGTISVANGAASTTSSTSFTVASSGAPTITSFTPTIGVQGTSVTISGANFQTTGATDKVLFGTMSAAVSLATATSLATVVPAPASSGKISVTTPFGIATSTTDFFDVPPGFNVADVQFTGRVTVGGTPVIATTTIAGKKGLILFDAAINSTGLSLQLTNVTSTGGVVSVFAPDGTLVTTGSVANALIGLPKLPMSGTYLIVLAPSAPSSITLSVTPATVLQVDGPATNVASVGTGYGALLSFAASAGQNLGLGLSGLTFAGGSGGQVRLTVVEPNGTTWPLSTNCYDSSPNGDCNLSLANLPLTGAYLLQVSNSYAALTNATFTLSSDKTGTLTSGTASTLSLRSGQNGRLTFAGTASQPATIRFENITTTPANQNVNITILNPNGTALSTTVGGSSSSNGADVYVASLPTTGAYTVIATPAYGVVTTMSMTLNPAPELVVDGAAVSITTSASGYGTSLSFSATAGQNLGLGLSGLTFAGGSGGQVRLTVVEPNGTTWPLSTNCYDGSPNGDCNLSLANLPLTGTYLLQVSNSYAALTNATFTLSSDKTGTLTSGTASTLSLRSGQNGRLTFAGTASQPATIRFENITTTPANQNVNITILNPDGTALSTTVGGSSSSNGADVYVASLPTTGAYTVIATPAYGVVTTMSMTLNPAPELVVDGAAVSITTSASGYGTSLSFSATAGQNLGLGLSGLTFAGGSGGQVRLTVVEPNGTTWPLSTNCYDSSPNGDCNLSLANLPLTGTYLLQVSNSYAALTNATFTLSSDKTGTLTSGTASTLSLRSGQNGRLTFAGTASQPATIRFENITTTPANQNVNITILNPDGTALSTTVGGSSSSNGADVYVASLPTTGAYTVIATPAYGVVTTMSMTLNPAPELVVDGAAVSITTSASGYGTSLSFSATAGQNLGLGLSGLTFAGGSGGQVRLTVVEPNGTTWPLSTNCYDSSPNGDCNLSLANLPLTGTYLLQVSNSYAALTNATFTLSSDKTGTLTSGTASTLSLRSGQNGRLTFAGTASQPATIRFENITTTPANQNVNITILNPNGTALSTTVGGSSSSNGADVYVASLPTTGAYTVIATPAYGVVTTMSMTLNPAPELVVDGAAVSITTSASGYGTSLSFSATAGQNLGLGLSGLTFAGGSGGQVRLTVVEPNGTTWPLSTNCYDGSPNGDCNLSLANLPLTGTYLLQVSNSYAALTNATFTLSSDKTGTLTSGTASTLSLRSGQNGRLTFAGTASQPATIRFENITTTPANQNVNITILNPDGTALSTTVGGSSSSNGADVYVASLPTTGAYTVIATPAYGVVTTMSMTLNPAPELVVDGAAVSITTSASGYGTSLSFSATAGQNLGLGLSGLTFAGGSGGQVRLTVVEPNGTTWPLSTNCYDSSPNGDCNLSLANLPLTGTYLLQVSNSYAALTNATFTLSSDKTGTLTSGTASTLSLRSGQNGRLTFAGTAAAHTLTIGVPTTVPAGQTVSVTVLDANSNAVSSGSYNTAGGVLTLGTLSASTYTVIVNTGYGAATNVTLTYH